MTNVIKFGRKVLTMGTVFSTILWSVGVSALVPSVAVAQTACGPFQPGTMIKVTGRPAIYSVDAAGRVLYFPSGDEFKSWNTGETYGGYTSVSQSCFDSLPVPTSAPLGVNFRPGSYVVKRPSSDQKYVVLPNNQLATITDAAATALYGSKVMTVADVFWPNYGNVRGTPVTEAKAHEGMLVSNGGKTYYVAAGGQLREVTAAGFTANRFKQAFVRPVASIAGFTTGSQITAAEASVGDRTQTGANPTTPPVSSGAVTVSLAADNPAGTILASGTAFNPVLKLNLTAGAQAVSITGLTVRKSGLAANSVVTGIEVVDAAGVRHGNIATSLTTDNDATILFASNPITIAAGTTQPVTVRVNLAAGSQSGTIQFSVVGANSVQGAAAGGSFPVSGNVFQIQTGTAAVGGASVDVQPVNAAGINVNIDAANQQEITKFRIDAGTSQENVRLSKFTIYNNGTGADTDVMDVQLVSQEGTVLATAQQVNKSVVFNLVTPYTIDKGTAKDLTVRAKVVAGIDRTIQYTVYNNYDVVLAGANTGAGILPTAGTTDTSFPVGDQAAAYNKVTVTSGTLSFNKDVTSPSTAVTPGKQGVVLGKWFAKPTGEDMELRTVSIAGTFNSVTGTAIATSSALTGSYTVKVNGVSVYNAAPSEIARHPAVTTLDISDVVLPAGQNSFITVESNVPSLASNGSTVLVYLDLTSVRKVVTNAISDPGVNLVGANTLSVQAAALKVTTLATPVAQSIVAGSTNVTLANFELSAGTVSSGEDVKITKIVVTDTLGGTTPAINDIGNLVLYNGTTPLATSVSTAVNGTSTSFVLVNPIIVPKSGSVNLTLKGDILTGTTGSHTFKINAAGDVTAIGVDTGNALSSTLTVSGNGQAMTVTAAGSLIVSAVTGASAAPATDQNVTVGATNVPVFAMKLTALNEPVKVTSLKLTASGTLNTVNNLMNIKLSLNADGSSPFATAAQMSESSTGSTTSTVYTWTATDNLLPSAVQPGAPITVYARADLGGAGIAVLGDSFRFAMNGTTSTDLVAKGASSGAPATVTGSAIVNSLSYVTPFSVSVAADSPIGSQTQTIVNGTQIAKVKVTNNGTSKVTIASMKFTNSGSGAPAAYDLLYSDQGSTVATNVAENAGDLDFTALAPITIDGGATRYFAVAIDDITGAGAGSTFQLSVAAHGDVTFTVLETDLGYSANTDGDLGDTSAALKAEGKPVLGTLTKS